ncbi:MAG: MOSC domain-containing protein [Pseudomonadota bacterium]
MEGALAELLARTAGPGEIVWIGLRPGRRAPIEVVETAEVTEAGLAGDHRARPGRRAVSLIQAEHLPVIAALAHRPGADLADLRRNIAVAGLNLLALRDRVLSLGTARLRITGPCHPCSRMEEALGPGGYSAMRGHGGMVAEVLQPGRIARGDGVAVSEV